MKDRPRSREAFRLAQELLPGGVNSPVRAFGAVGGDPPVIDRGSGAFIYDLDGNRYADYVCAYGPMILGHAHPAVVAAIRDAAAAGMAFGAPTKLETELAQRVVGAVPSIDQVRFVNSGTEATMTAIRLAHGHTGRNKVVKFAGGYHGHADGLLAKAGSGVATLGLPDSAGVPAGYAAETLVARYNDLENVAQIVSAYGDDLAAVIVEPVAANMGVVPPASGFLEGLRDLTLGVGALLIFDEVITGFRVQRGGAQALYGVTPDLTCLGKIIGGGLPIGAVGGPQAIMEQLAPLGPVYQAGTLAGNAVAMAAGVATLDALLEPGVYETLERPGCPARVRGRRGCAALGDRGRREPGRFVADRLLSGGAAGRLRRGASERHQGLRALLPRGAGRRGEHRALPVRGDVRLDGAHERRSGLHGGGAWAGFRGGGPGPIIRVIHCPSTDFCRARRESPPTRRSVPSGELQLTGQLRRLVSIYRGVYL